MIRSIALMQWLFGAAIMLASLLSTSDASAMTLFVRLEDSSTITLEVENSDSIENIKIQLSGRLDIPPEYFRLVFAGRDLDDGRTLSDYRINDEATIFLFVEGYDAGVDAAVEPDASEPDASVEPDAAEADASSPDASEPDAAVDASEPDAAVDLDASFADAAVDLDASFTDASLDEPDAASFDASAPPPDAHVDDEPDTGLVLVPAPRGCSCGIGGNDEPELSSLAWLAALGFAVSRRRR